MTWDTIREMRAVLASYAQVKAGDYRMIPGPVVMPETLYRGTPLATIVFPAIQYNEWAEAWSAVLKRAGVPGDVRPFPLGNGYVAAAHRDEGGDRRALDDALRALPTITGALAATEAFIREIEPRYPDPKPFPWLKTAVLVASASAAGVYSYRAVRDSRLARFA